MELDHFYLLFYENKQIISGIDELTNCLFNYDLEKLNQILKEQRLEKKLLIYFKSKYFYYSYDIKNLEKLQKEIDYLEHPINILLKIEYLLLKRKLQEISGYSRLSNEISRLSINLSKNDNSIIQSIAKTFEGDNFSFLNEYYSAQNSYSEAIAIDSNNLRARIGYAKSFYYLEDYKNSEIEFDNLLKNFQNTAIKKYKGKILKKREKFPEALKMFEEIIKIDKYYMDTYFDLFDIYRKLKDRKNADEVINKIQKEFNYFCETYEFKYYKALNCYLQGNYDDALTILNDLSKYKYESPYTLYLKGKISSKKGVGVKNKDEREIILKKALEFFLLSIEYYNNELMLLRNSEEINKIIIRKLSNQLKTCFYSYSITLSHLNKYDESLDVLFDLLKGEPENYYYLKSIAITYTQAGDYDNAIKYFDLSLKISSTSEVKVYDNSKSALLREYCFCLMKKNKYEEAKKWIKEALNLNRNDYKIHLTFGEILYHLQDYDNAEKYTMDYLEKDIELKYDDLAKENLKLISIARTGKRPNEKEINKREIINKLNSLNIRSTTIKTAEEEFIKRINSPKTLKRNENYLLILRKWNSYTPILNTTNSKGGGYFICFKGKGFVIDPGLNFLENFFSSGLSLKDIDYIFISHAHNDHMADLESILTLLYKYNKNTNKREKKHKIELFLNIGTFKKYSSNIDLTSKFEENPIRKVVIMNPDENYKISSDFSLKTLKANHDEILTDAYCLSFIFKLGERIITFTNDSGYSLDYGKKILNDKPDILVAHIGTIKENEFRNSSFYEKHLGLNGLIELIEKSNAKINIISEFGEELKHFRSSIANSFAEVFKKNVFPGDIGFKININQLKIKESFSIEYPPKIENLKYISPDLLTTTEINEKVFIFQKSIKNVSAYISNISTK